MYPYSFLSRVFLKNTNTNLQYMICELFYICLLTNTVITKRKLHIDQISKTERKHWIIQHPFNNHFSRAELKRVMGCKGGMPSGGMSTLNEVPGENFEFNTSETLQMALSRSFSIKLELSEIKFMKI